jgi:hypothetical protein
METIVHFGCFFLILAEMLTRITQCCGSALQLSRDGTFLYAPMSRLHQPVCRHQPFIIAMAEPTTAAVVPLLPLLLLLRTTTVYGVVSRQRTKSPFWHSSTHSSPKFFSLQSYITCFFH